jgi:hypothetical protein
MTGFYEYGEESTGFAKLHNFQGIPSPMEMTSPFKNNPLWHFYTYVETSSMPEWVKMNNDDKTLKVLITVDITRVVLTLPCPHITLQLVNGAVND